MPAEGLGAPNVVAMFARRVSRNPDLPALRFKRDGIWRTLTWSDWHRAALAVAAGLRCELKVARGDRVVLMAGSGVEWAVCDLAIAMAGAVSVPIYPSASATQASVILADSGAVAAIVGNASQVLPIAAGRGPLRHVVIDAAGVLEQRSADPPWISLDALQATGAGVASARAELAEIEATLTLADPFTIAYTAGTAGDPKGAVLTHRNIVYKAWAIKSVIAVDRSDEQLMVLPLAHMFARHLLWGAVEQGAVTAFAPPRVDLGPVFQEVAPTYLCGVPNLYDRLYQKIHEDMRHAGLIVRTGFEQALEVGRKVSMCRQRGQSIPPRIAFKASLADRLYFSKIKKQFGGRLRFFVTGGAPLRREVAEFFHAVGILILEGYGLTETTGATHVNRPDRFRFGTVGPAIPGSEVRIADDGEVLIRGNGVMQGYHQRPEATAAVLDPDGWLHTGDIGEVRDGFLTITDRKKDLILTSTGRSIAPQPLEGQLRLAQGIAHAMVVGDGRPALVALVSLDETALLALSQREGLGCKSYSDLAQHPRVQRLVQSHIDRLNADLASDEAIRSLAIVPMPWTEANDSLTATRNLRRGELLARHADLIDALYSTLRTSN